MPAVPAPAGKRLALRWLGVVPFAAFLAAVPDPADDEHRRSAHSRRRTASFTLDNIRGLNTPSIVSAYWISIQLSLIIRGARLPHRLCHGGGRHASGVCRAALRATAADLLGRRLQFRRRAAGLRLPRDARSGRPRHGLAAHRIRHQPARRSASTCCRSGACRHLSVLPDPADDPDHHAGARRAEARVARGGRDPRRHRRAVLAHGRASRSCCRRCSARSRCCSPTRSAPSRRPSR